MKKFVLFALALGLFAVSSNEVEARVRRAKVVVKQQVVVQRAVVVKQAAVVVRAPVVRVRVR